MPIYEIRLRRNEMSDRKDGLRTFDLSDLMEREKEKHKETETGRFLDASISGFVHKEHNETSEKQNRLRAGNNYLTG
jgi:hypothetical protein